MTTLTEKGMLCRLSIHQWTARRFDREVSDEVADIHGAAADSGRFNKLLLPRGALLGLQTSVNALRAHHETNTLPWTLHGVGLLPAANYFPYVGEHRRLKLVFEAARRDFIAGFDAAKVAAQASLGDLYRETDYPAAEDLERRISCELQVMPIPEAKDFRISLGEFEEARIRDEIEANVRGAMEAAVRSLWQRIYDTVFAMQDRLAKYRKDPETDKVTAPFRDSLVGNLRELVELLPRLNLTDDPALRSMTEHLAMTLCKAEPAELRDDEALRARNLAECQTVLSVMAGYIGGPIAMAAE